MYSMYLINKNEKNIILKDGYDTIVDVSFISDMRFFDIFKSDINEIMACYRFELLNYQTICNIRNDISRLYFSWVENEKMKEIEDDFYRKLFTL